MKTKEEVIVDTIIILTAIHFSVKHLADGHQQGSSVLVSLQLTEIIAH